MTTAPLAHADTLVLEYLTELWTASEDLPPGPRDELMRTVTDYLAARQEPGADPGPVLSRMGTPGQLAEAARRGYLPLRPPRHPAPVIAAPTVPLVGGAEFTAIALLVGGNFVLPVVGSAAGMLVASGSSRWSGSQKGAGWVLCAGGPGAALVLVTLLASMGFSAAPTLFLGYLAACAGSVGAGLMLLGGLRAGPGQR
ncbi:hypothetical protein ACWT_2485 [Actinoplanes sp. SE50]|uniref:HAAS signaling domain-containing protein n=1 Tax=unclassified Actinoplanes TaxID=2626549 RepID=UPI00023ED5DF|nr:MULTISPECIES: hypothetical protein [unclassified Actinoplanes]AEV83956.1 hypothetical protein ACPL_3061 [Actinoplanes sp. SE50/110]ATO81900.1 hypothetical protein ACWT_2485 [Actinoplanes sp. SE50]SLL99308.1 hypothetical protein ACSP50_2539 [Actinoplanes sp. SE50/110]